MFGGYLVVDANTWEAGTDLIFVITIGKLITREEITNSLISFIADIHFSVDCTQFWANYFTCFSKLSFVCLFLSFFIESCGRVFWLSTFFCYLVFIENSRKSRKFIPKSYVFFKSYCIVLYNYRHGSFLIFSKGRDSCCLSTPFNILTNRITNKTF